MPQESEDLPEAFPVEPYVNLWELITTIATHQKGYLSNQEQCQAIKNACYGNQYPSFGSELDLKIDPRSGAWTIKIFSHNEPSERYVELTVGQDGYITVSRGREVHDVREYRSISF